MTLHESTRATPHEPEADALALAPTLGERARAVRELRVALEVACATHGAEPGTPCLPPTRAHRLGLTCLDRLDAALEARVAAEFDAAERRRAARRRERGERRLNRVRRIVSAVAGATVEGPQSDQRSKVDGPRSAESRASRGRSAEPLTEMLTDGPETGRNLEGGAPQCAPSA